MHLNLDLTLADLAGPVSVLFSAARDPEDFSRGAPSIFHPGARMGLESNQHRSSLDYDFPRPTSQPKPQRIATPACVPAGLGGQPSPQDIR